MHAYLPFFFHNPNGIVSGFKLLKAYVFAKGFIAVEGDTQPSQNLFIGIYKSLVESEIRDAISENASYSGKAVVHIDCHAFLREPERSAYSGRAGTDDGDFLAG